MCLCPGRGRTPCAATTPPARPRELGCRLPRTFGWSADDAHCQCIAHTSNAFSRTRKTKNWDFDFFRFGSRDPKTRRFATGDGSGGDFLLQRLSYRCQAAEMSGTSPYSPTPCRFTCCMRSVMFRSSLPGTLACSARAASHMRHVHACIDLSYRYKLTSAKALKRRFRLTVCIHTFRYRNAL